MSSIDPIFHGPLAYAALFLFLSSIFAFAYFRARRDSKEPMVQPRRVRAAVAATSAPVNGSAKPVEPHAPSLKPRGDAIEPREPEAVNSPNGSVSRDPASSPKPSDQALPSPPPPTGHESTQSSDSPQQNPDPLVHHNAIDADGPWWNTEHSAPAKIDAIDLEQNSDVVFTVQAPKHVPMLRHFIIELRVEGILLTDNAVDEPVKPDEFMAQVHFGSRLSFILLTEDTSATRRNSTSSSMITFAPYQASTWRSKDLIITFHARSSKVDNDVDVRGTIYAMINGIQIGMFEFDMKIIKDDAPPQYKTRRKMMRGVTADSLKIDQDEALVRASKIQKAFICYESDVYNSIIGIGLTLEAAGIECYVDRLDMRPTISWQSWVRQTLRSVDLVVIALTPSVHSNKHTAWELQELVVELGRRKENRLKQIQVSLFPSGGNIRDHLPPRLLEYLNESNRWDSVAAFYEKRAEGKILKSPKAIAADDYRPFKAARAERTTK